VRDKSRNYRCRHCISSIRRARVAACGHAHRHPILTAERRLSLAVSELLSATTALGEHRSLMSGKLIQPSSARGCSRRVGRGDIGRSEAAESNGWHSAAIVRRRQCLHGKGRRTSTQAVCSGVWTRGECVRCGRDRATSVQMDEDGVCRSRLRGEKVFLADDRTNSRCVDHRLTTARGFE